MDKFEDIVKYRLLRSGETLEEAKLMAGSHHWNAAMNRLYYAAYYAVSALLYNKNLFAKTHSGLKGQFSQYFIKTNKIDPSYGELFSVLFASRQEGDYEDLILFAETDVEPLIEKVSEFIEEVKRHISI